MLTFEGDLFCDTEIVAERMFPVDEFDSDAVFPSAGLDIDTVAQQFIDLSVCVDKASIATESGRFVEFIQDFGDDLVVVLSAPEPIGQQIFLNVAIILTRVPVAEVAIPQSLLEKCDNAFLCAYFGFANSVHGGGCQYGFLHNPSVSSFQ